MPINPEPPTRRAHGPYSTPRDISGLAFVAAAAAHWSRASWAARARRPTPPKSLSLLVLFLFRSVYNGLPASQFDIGPLRARHPRCLGAFCLLAFAGPALRCQDAPSPRRPRPSEHGPCTLLVSPIWLAIATRMTRGDSCEPSSWTLSRRLAQCV